MTGRKQGYRPAGDDDTRATLADGPAPGAEATRRILAILRGGAR